MRFVSLWAIAAIAMGSGWSCSSPSPSMSYEEFVGRPAPPPQTSDAPDVRHGALWYHLEPHGDGIAVRMRLLNPPPAVTFFLPGAWAGEQFDDLFRLGQARGPEQSLSMTVDRREGRIDVEAPDQAWLEISYLIELQPAHDDEHRFFPWGSEEAFFAYAPTILIMPSAGIAQQLRDIPIEVHLPRDWIMASTWAPEHHDGDDGTHQVHGFIADDIASLRDAFVAGAADWRRLQYPLSDGILDMYLTQEFGFDDRSLLESAATITGEYLHRFGEYDRISGLILPLPDGAPDRLRGTGRHGGFVLEVPADQELDDALLLLLAHEAFHMWNGHRLVPAPDYRDQGQWFKEGVTHYIALKTLSRLGLIADKTVREELAQAGQLYLQSPLITGTEVQAIDRIRFPYDRGLLIALALDLHLWEHTDGEVEVEDWIAVLLADPFQSRGRAYDARTLREAFQAMAGDHLDAPLRTYRRFTDPNTTIDIRELYYRLGLHFLQPDPHAHSRALPIEGQTAPYEALFHTPPHPR